VSLPGADELFRATGGQGRAQARDVQTGQPEPIGSDAVGSEAVGGNAVGGGSVRLAPVRTTSPARAGGRPTGRPSGREKHDEKITVYVSPEELLVLEQARLDLRAVHGLAVDRGRVVREAVALVLADLEAKGADSILVRRLRDR
jgi:hypothetical protein